MLIKYQIPDEIKKSKFKSSKTISSFINHYPKTKQSPLKKRSYSFDNINEKLEHKLNFSNRFPISESYSLMSNSKEDLNFIPKINKNYKKFKTFDHVEKEPEIKKNCSSNVVNSTNKLREGFLEKNNESKLKIKIKRPNFLIKSCFYQKNSEIYQSKISRAFHKQFYKIIIILIQINR